MGQVRSEKNQVSRLVIAKTIADYALPFTVADERELKFRMVVPIEGKVRFDPLVSSKGAESFSHFLESGQHSPNANTVAKNTQERMRLGGIYAFFEL